MSDFRVFDLIQTGFRGDRKAFMEATGLSKGRIAQLLDENEPFGDVAVARLEKKLSIKGYFDAPDTQAAQKQSSEAPASDLERDLLLSFRHLPDQIKDELVRDLMRLAIDFSPAKDVFRKYGLERAATADRVAQHIDAAPTVHEPTAVYELSSNYLSEQKREQTSLDVELPRVLRDSL